MSRPTARLRTSVVLGVLAALLAPVLATALATPASAAVLSVESRLLSLTNADRASHGLPALKSSSTLVAVARAWSDHMAATGTMGHNPSLAAKVTGWSSLGENVAMAYSADQAESLFMSSAGHRANILATRYNRIGIGVTKGTNGGYWITVDFEQTSGYTPHASSPPKPARKAPTTHVTSTSRSQVASRTSRSTVRGAVPAVRPAVLPLAVVPLTATQLGTAARLTAMDRRATSSRPTLASPVAAGEGTTPDGRDLAAEVILVGGLAVSAIAGAAVVRPARVRALTDPFRRGAGG